MAAAWGEMADMRGAIMQKRCPGSCRRAEVGARVRRTRTVGQGRMVSYQRTVLAVLLTCVLPLIAGAAQHRVPAGGDLQAALNEAQPGDEILLAAGATFVGNFVLPFKEGAAFVTVRT